MEEQFVNFNESLEMNQLGFIEPCFAYYGELNGGEIFLFLKNNYDIQAIGILAPLWQQAFDFFREQYELMGVINFNEVAKNYYYYIFSMEGEDNPEYRQKHFETYQEARLDCITSLIKRAKLIRKELSL
jgi:hypothetical protein